MALGIAGTRASLRVTSAALVRPVVLVALVVLAAAACSPAAAPSPAGDGRPTSLEGTAWRVVSIAGRTPPAGTVPTLVVGPGRLTGNAGCNTFAGSFVYDPSTGGLTVGELGSTKRACAEPARNDVETAYLEALRGVAMASVDAAGRLVLRGSGAELVLAQAPTS